MAEGREEPPPINGSEDKSDKDDDDLFSSVTEVSNSFDSNVR
jgi:hypothetical protein